MQAGTGMRAGYFPVRVRVSAPAGAPSRALTSSSAGASSSGRPPAWRQLAEEAYARRQEAYWRSEANVASSVARAVDAIGPGLVPEGQLPRVCQLRQLAVTHTDDEDLSALALVVAMHHGGLRGLERITGLRRPPRGPLKVWPDAGALDREIWAFLWATRALGTAQGASAGAGKGKEDPIFEGWPVFPTAAQFRAAGRSDLAAGVRAHGGWDVTASRMGLRSRRPGGVETGRGMLRAFQTYLDAVGRPGGPIPSASQMERDGRKDLARALVFWGGRGRVARKLGVLPGEYQDARDAETVSADALDTSLAGAAAAAPFGNGWGSGVADDDSGGGENSESVDEWEVDATVLQSMRS